MKRSSAVLGIALGLAVLPVSPGLCPAAEADIAGAEELGASSAAARAGEGELAPPEFVRDASLEPAAAGAAQLPRPLAAHLGEALEQKAARAAEGAMAPLEAREAERAAELMRSAAGRVKQDLAGVVERRLLPAPNGDAEFVAYARGEVRQPSPDGAAGTALEITPPVCVEGSAGSPSTITVGVAQSPAIAAPELPLDIDVP